MPFRGIPSKNCSNCRERRIKCDRLQPVCSQCRRAGKICGGYRDVQSMLFHDENERTRRRSVVANSRSERQRQPRQRLPKSSLPGFNSPLPRSPVLPALSSSSNIVVHREDTDLLIARSIPASVSFSAEEQGLKFFFEHFVTAVSAREYGYSCNVHSSPSLRSILFNFGLRDAVISVGLAGLSNVTGNGALRIEAREKYVAAINMVRHALENSAQVDRGRTLKTMVMLCLYEVVSCTTNWLDSWTVHLDGAVVFLKQTAFSQGFKSKNYRAQLQFYFASIIRYFLTQGNFPVDLADWSLEFFSPAPEDLPAVYLIDIFTRIVKLHSSICQCPAPEPADVICAALQLDAELDEWEAHLPAKWSPVMRISNDLQLTFYGKYHVYNDMWAARILNHYRWGRLYVNEMILLHVSKLESPALGDLTQSRRALHLISQLAEDICASAAHQIGVFNCTSLSNEPRRTPLLNGAFMLLFPLAVAGSAAGVPAEVHDWVVGTLRRIGSTMGIRRALELIPGVQEVCCAWNLNRWS